MTVYTLFGQPASPGSSLIADNGSYTMTVEFSTSAGCTATAIWWYSISGALLLPSTIAIFTVSGATLLHSESASWSGAVGSGWVRAAFSSPPTITASTSYKAAIFTTGTGGSNYWYSATNNYWSSGAGSGGITSGILTAPNSASANVGQDAYFSGSSLTYPNSVFQAQNYWVDIEVTTSGAPAGSVQPLATVPVARRRPARGVTGFTPVVTVNTGHGPAGRAQPLAASLVAPRRKPARAVVQFIPVTTTNAPAKPHPAHGTPSSDEARGWKRWLLWGP